MENKEVAQNLRELAEIMELKGDKYRSLAYEKAAQTVENLSINLKTIHSKEELDKLPGIGPSIAEKIEEIIETGHLEYLDKLKSQVPQGVLELEDIPGIGPRTALELVEKLEVKSIAELAKKIESAEAKEYFGTKTLENIREGIEMLKRRTGRYLLTEVLPVAEELVSALRKMDEVEKADFVGSLRRMKETVGDIDLVAASKKPARTIEEFTHLSQVDQILEKGETKATVILKNGFQIDLEILPRDQYGSLLQHFTGSREHNIHLRTYALSKGMSISEHGIKKGTRLLKFKDEKAVYDALGLEYVSPELREDRGEIEAALEKRLPQLVQYNDIRGDLHVHTTESDGRNTLEEMAQAAQKMGYEYICISDHSPGLGVTSKLTADDFLNRIEKTRKIQDQFKIKTLIGSEVNIRVDGSLDLPDKVLSQLDIVIASIHSSFRQSEEQMTQRIIRALSNPHVHILGHPSGRLIEEREAIAINWTELFSFCRKSNKALEINSSPHRLDLKDNLVQDAVRAGIKLVINTDAHSIEGLELMRYGVAVAQRGWCEKKDVLNTHSYKQLMDWVKR